MNDVFLPLGVDAPTAEQTASQAAVAGTATKMSKFKAVEYCSLSCRETGVVEIYTAASIEAAVEAVLYTRRLEWAKAYIGHTGRVVYGMAYLAYAISPCK